MFLCPHRALIACVPGLRDTTQGNMVNRITMGLQEKRLGWPPHISCQQPLPHGGRPPRGQSVDVRSVEGALRGTFETRASSLGHSCN